MGSIELRPATPGDLPALLRLLAEAALPAEDVAFARQTFVLALDGGRVVGSIALELAGKDALVRSLAVAPSHRRQGLAAALDERASALARERGLSALYLLTTTARGYALRRGYEVVDRAEVPPAVAALPQFRSLCPASATCMRLRLGAGPA